MLPTFGRHKTSDAEDRRLLRLAGLPSSLASLDLMGTTQHIGSSSGSIPAPAPGSAPRKSRSYSKDSLRSVGSSVHGGSKPGSRTSSFRKRGSASGEDHGAGIAAAAAAALALSGPRSPTKEDDEEDDEEEDEDEEESEEDESKSRASAAAEAEEKRNIVMDSLFPKRISAKLLRIERPLSMEDIAKMTSSLYEHTRVSISDVMKQSKSVLVGKSENNIEKRRAAVLELLRTESSYFNKVAALELNYPERMKAHNNIKGVASVLPEKDIDLIFLNITEIRRLHEDLLEDLRESTLDGLDESRIADILRDYATRMEDIYIRYTSDFESSCRVLDSFRKHGRFSRLIKVNEHLLSQKLDALRMEPIQRIPRYLLLLNTIKSNSKSGSVLAAKLDAAILAYQSLSEEMDIHLQIAQGKAQLRLLQQHLWKGRFNIDDGKRFVVRHSLVKSSRVRRTSGSDTTPTSSLVKTGSTILSPEPESKSKSTELKESELIMLNDMLIFCKDETEQYHPKQYFLLKNIVVIDMADRDASGQMFEIKCNQSGRRERVLVTSKREKEEWIADLKKYANFAIKHTT